MPTHILGIRHHGVGSAKKVAERLQQIKPDIILIEGPPEITEMLKHIGKKDLVPPVALMVYNSKIPATSTFYPFADFSPEWVAAKYANKNKIPVRAMDLPAAISFKIQENEHKALQKKAEELATKMEENPEAIALEEVQKAPKPIKDPLSYMAEASGFRSGEDWWEHQFEKVSATPAEEHFEAVHLTMKTLRDENILSSLDEENVAREAYMRDIIQAVQLELYNNIVVVCGAWHGPELYDIDDKIKEDQKVLKKLPKSKIDIACTWIPWTNGRLSMFSGYGAGLRSPGWYEHQWNKLEDMEVEWLSKVATAFRADGVDISTAHVLETYRLAHALAALRNKSHISLEELNESIHTVMCMGDSILFELIKKKIIVGEKLGKIPDELPKVPLQKDFETTAKSLRLTMSAMEKKFALDLRKPLDLKRSIFFHRLELLELNWATRAESRSKGTFKESWVLEWAPEMQIALIDKAHFGNTLVDASVGYIYHKMNKTRIISELVKLVEFCIPVELFDSIDKLLLKINNESAISADTKDLMTAIPGLVEIIKYGNVRKTDVTQLRNITIRLFSKVCVSLSNACYGLDEQNSNDMFELISQVNNAVEILEEDDVRADWYNALEMIVNKQGVHNVIIGCTVRLLFDNNRLTKEESTNLFSYFLSASNEPVDVAHWMEGFLRGSGLILIYDDRIWNLIFQWVDQVGKEVFMELLPVLRRAFSKFPFGERRQIGQKAKAGVSKVSTIDDTDLEVVFDEQQAASILPFITKLLGTT